MNVMNLIQNNYEEAIAMILFGIGFSNLLLQQNLIKKIIGLNIMDTAMYLFLALKGYISGQESADRGKWCSEGDGLYQSDPGGACTDGHRRIRIGDCTYAFPDDPAVPKVSYFESR